MSGLEPGQSFDIFLVFRTSAGTYRSNTLLLMTKKEDDMAGLFLHIYGDENEEIEQLATEMGCNVLKGQPDFDAKEGNLPTHVVATSCSVMPADIMLQARAAGIPLVTPDWLHACHLLKRLCPVDDFLSK
jgi:hypothetical protein